MNDKKNDFKKLLKNTGILISGDVTASIINVVALIIVTNKLGLEIFGWMVLITTYAQTVDKLVNFQSWQALIKFGSESVVNKNNRELKSYVKQGFILDLVSAIVGTLIGLSAVNFVGEYFEWNDTVIILTKIYCLSILFNVTGTSIGILRLFNNFKVFSYNKIFVSILKLVIALTLYMEISFESFIISNLIVECLGFILLVVSSLKVLLRNNLRYWYKEKIGNIKPFLKFTVYSNLTSTFDVPVKQLDVFIVNAVVSVEAVGVYRIIKQVVAIISKLIDPMYQAVYPTLTSLCANKKFDDANLLVKQIARLVIIFGAPLVIVASLTSQIWLSLFFGEKISSYYFEMSLLLFLKLISVIFVGIHPLFVALGYVRINVYILLVSNFIYMISAYYLGSAFGLLGIVLSYGVQFMIVIISKIWIMKSLQQDIDKIDRESVV